MRPVCYNEQIQNFFAEVVRLKNEIHSPLVSVIVPVFNVAPYIHEALDSVVNQTYKNLECCLVDDGSTDDSGEICDEYAARDNRFG